MTRNPLAAASTYLQEVRSELAKVTWPTRQETIALTQVVVVISIIIALYLGVIDFMLTEVTKLILR